MTSFSVHLFLHYKHALPAFFSGIEQQVDRGIKEREAFDQKVSQLEAEHLHCLEAEKSKFDSEKSILLQDFETKFSSLERRYLTEQNEKLQQLNESKNAEFEKQLHAEKMRLENAFNVEKHELNLQFNEKLHVEKMERDKELYKLQQEHQSLFVEKAVVDDIREEIKLEQGRVFEQNLAQEKQKLELTSEQRVRDEQHRLELDFQTRVRLEKQKLEEEMNQRNLLVKEQLQRELLEKTQMIEQQKQSEGEQVLRTEKIRMENAFEAEKHRMELLFNENLHKQRLEKDKDIPRKKCFTVRILQVLHDKFALHDRENLPCKLPKGKHS